ncbi:MAG: hypothetical protein JRI68_08445 [Deltaproteobacteria bacterium]|nr:hypothetical protein [Deltaproteobacteria bacterium]
MARITWTGAGAAIALMGLTTTVAAQDPPDAKPETRKTPASKTPASKAPVAKAPPDEPAADGGTQKAGAKRFRGAKGKEEAPPCPPGAFCEEQEVTPPEEALTPEEAEEAAAAAEAEAAADEDGTTVVLPPPRPGDDPGRPRTFTYVPDPDGGPGQVIIYEDGAGPPHFPGDEMEPAPPPPPPPPEKRKWRRHRRWGLNLRIDGALLPRMGDEQADVGMAGMGLSLRYRPIPHFALDLSGDFLGGHDSNGFERQEVPISASAMLYVNPRSLAQFYFFGGLNWSFARVQSDELQAHFAEGTQDDYTYFGGHLGAGLEFRVARLIGINIDGLAFARTRTDDDGDGRYPEYIDPDSGETSNTSTAGLLRAGVTFWW